MMEKIYEDEDPNKNTETLGKKDMKQNVKNFFKRAGEMFHRIGFYIVTLLLIGAIGGGYAMSWYQKTQLKDAELLGGMVYNKKVFDFKERIIVK